MTYRPELQGRPRRRLLAQVRREEPNCWICGHPIDLTLNRQTHPMGSTVDEIIPRSRSIDPRRAALTRTNLRHSHRACNTERGNRITQDNPTSRVW